MPKQCVCHHWLHLSQHIQFSLLSLVQVFLHGHESNSELGFDAMSLSFDTERVLYLLDISHRPHTWTEQHLKHYGHKALEIPCTNCTTTISSYRTRVQHTTWLDVNFRENDPRLSRPGSRGVSHYAGCLGGWVMTKNCSWGWHISKSPWLDVLLVLR